MSKLIQTLKGYQAVKELIEGELSDYSYFKAGELEWNDAYGEYEDDDEQEHYSIDITIGHEDKRRYLNFNYNKQEDTIEIELGEDSWQEVTDYDYKVKYFWMALLEW